jgi:hypothetical protein
MRLSKLLSVVFLLTSIVLISCTSKAPKDLIVNKWKLTEVSGEGAKNMSDAEKKDMVGKLVMDIQKDGKCSVSGIGETPKKGTYTISDDGKTLNLTGENETKSTPQQINQLTSDKLSITDPESKLVLTFSSK